MKIAACKGFKTFACHSVRSEESPINISRLIEPTRSAPRPADVNLIIFRV